MTLPAKSSFSSADLRRLCDERDPRAWLEFVAAATPGIQAEIRAVFRARGAACPGPDDLDDLVQNVFVRLCEDDCHLLRTYDPARSAALATFLSVVTHSTTLDFLKRQPNVVFEPIEAAEALAVAPVLPADPVEIPEGILTPREASLLRLLAEEGLSTDEAAESLGMTREAFYMCKSRVINKMKAHRLGEPVS